MTLGSKTAFARMVTPVGTFNLEAFKKDDDYLGWIINNQFLPSVRNNVSKSDAYKLSTTRVSSKLRSPGVITTSSSALTNNDISTTQLLSFNGNTVSDGNNILFVLENSLVDLSVTATNIRGVTLDEVVIELFFVLDNSDFVASSSGCVEGTPIEQQQFLRCNLGPLAAGASATASYQVRVASYESVLANSASSTDAQIAVGAFLDEESNSSSFGFINIIADVLSDSDGDGISDFNEELAGTNASSASSVFTGDVDIDLMIVYTAGAAAAVSNDIDTILSQIMAVTNQVYDDSQVEINLRLVHSVEVNYNDTDSAETALDNISAGTSPFDNIESLRTQFGADLVMLLRASNGSNLCGLATLAGVLSGNPTLGHLPDPSTGYSTVYIDCLDDTTAHELGHNMGLSHSRRQDITENFQGSLGYGTGYGIDDRFTTVMAYGEVFNTFNNIFRFSSPDDLNCENQACGIDSTDLVNGANAVKSLNITRFQIANYTSTVVADAGDSGDSTEGNDSTDGSDDTSSPGSSGTEIDLSENSAYVSGILHVPFVRLNDNRLFSVDLTLIANSPLEFQVTKVTALESSLSPDTEATYAGGLLTLPVVNVGSKQYSVTMMLASSKPLQFDTVKATLL